MADFFCKSVAMLGTKEPALLFFDCHKRGSFWHE